MRVVVFINILRPSAICSEPAMLWMILVWITVPGFAWPRKMAVAVARYCELIL